MNNFHLPGMPVVMLCDFVDEEVKADAVKAGVNHLFAKPVSSTLSFRA